MNVYRWDRTWQRWDAICTAVSDDWAGLIYGALEAYPENRDVYAVGHSPTDPHVRTMTPAPHEPAR